MERIEVRHKLYGFRKEIKFSADLWQQKGLNPPSGGLYKYCEMRFNACADRLMTAIDEGADRDTIRQILIQALFSFKRTDFIVGDRLVIGNMFFHLSQILNINIRSEISVWFSGKLKSELVRMIKNMVRLIPGTKEILIQSCRHCFALFVFNLKKKHESRKENWLIFKCKKCDQYNLLDLGAGIAKIKFNGIEYVDELQKSEYTEEQALLRMEQIEIFRR